MQWKKNLYCATWWFPFNGFNFQVKFHNCFKVYKYLINVTETGSTVCSLEHTETFPWQTHTSSNCVCDRVNKDFWFSQRIKETFPSCAPYITASLLSSSLLRWPPGGCHICRLRETFAAELYPRFLLSSGWFKTPRLLWISHNARPAVSQMCHISIHGSDR